MKLFTPKIEKMTLEQLTNALANLTRQRRELAEKAKGLQDEYDARMAVARVKSDLDKMTPQQRKALSQEIEARSIESSEEFGDL